MSYSYARDLKAGCFECNGDQAMWFAKNAQGVAARHHQATGHSTWVDVSMSIWYGKPPSDGPSKPTTTDPTG